MTQLYCCAAHASDTERSTSIASKPDHRPFTIDIHCHIHVPEVDAEMAPFTGPSIEPMLKFLSPASNEVNKRAMAEAIPKLTSVDTRLADMERMGIDMQVISPSPAQYYYFADPDAARDAARTINDRIAAVVADHPERLVGLCTLPLQAPQLAVAELRRCVKDLGFRGVEIGTNVAGIELADPKFRAFFAAAEDLDILIFMHPLGFTHGERMRDHYFTNVIGNPLDSTLAVGHLIFGGVLDRYPRLKLCVAHGGGYLPAYAGRMEHAFAAREDCRVHISRPPSHYLKQIYFDTLVFDRDQLAYLIKKFGADHLLLGSDYPFDMAEPDPAGFVFGMPNISDSDRSAIMGGNAARLLGLDAINRQERTVLLGEEA